MRGYEEGEEYGDNGLPLLRKLGWQEAGDGLQVFGFEDFSMLWSTHRLVGERHYTDLHSVGVGCRYNVRQNLNVSFAYGWQLRDSHASRSGDNSRAHLSVQLAF